MIRQRKIELLAPAKNLECGIEAINHGADAVYIGAPKFGARAAAVNSLEDIEALVKHAHLYNARIYVTVNTILKEEELEETEEMIQCPYLCHRQYDSERRGTGRDGRDDSCPVSDRCGCSDCAGYGNYETESSSDSSPCQYTDGQSHTGEGEIPLGSRFPSGGSGAGTVDS